MNIQLSRRHGKEKENMIKHKAKGVNFRKMANEKRQNKTNKRKTKKQRK